MRRRTNPTRPLRIGKIPADYKPIITAALDQGFELTRRPGGHLALKRDSGTVFFSSSPRDRGRHSAKKIVSDLRRLGLEYPPKP